MDPHLEAEIIAVQARRIAAEIAARAAWGKTFLSSCLLWECIDPDVRRLKIEMVEEVLSVSTH